MTRTAIDPITRIEGHLRLEVEHTGGVVQDAWSTGTMFRGIERILAGRDPREAWVFAQRACGVCTHVHALASVRAVEDALNITVPTNARIIRNLMSGTQLVHDHVIHFYHLHALDWVDLAAALNADPAATAALAAKNNPKWPKGSTAYFKGVLTKLSSFAASGLGPFANGYWGHPAYRLNPEEDLLFMAHFLEALEWQRSFIRIHAILGGKNPHPQTYVVGGMSIGFAPNVPRGTGVDTAALNELAGLATYGKAFVHQVLLPDVRYLARRYPEWANTGEGLGRYLAYGDLPERDGAPGSGIFPTGRVLNRDLTNLHPVDQARIAETVARSWYRYPASDAELRHPYRGLTEPAYSGPTPPYDHILTEKYSWLKAPRYDGLAYEVGPLARMAVGYAAGHADVRDAVDRFLRQAGLTRPELFSTVGRIGARAVETGLVADRLPVWVAQLQANQRAGNLTVAATAKWDPATWPATAQGWGATEAPRGALGHWIRIRNETIANYQMVVPSTWNGSPRDAGGNRGAWETAVLGTPLADPARPLEILRTIHSFDPCMGCAVHLHDPDTGSAFEVEMEEHPH